MMDELSRVFNYAVKFYLSRVKLVVLFSIPFLVSILLLSIVAAPTYTALGGVFLRTGSVPDLSALDVLLTVIAYLVSVYIIADSIVNINLITLSKRTLSDVKSEIVGAMGSYALRIFYVFTIMILLFFLVQLLTYDSVHRSLLYPLFVFLVSFFTFFVPPAVVVDHSNTAEALSRSVSMALKKPVFIIIWGLLGFVAFAIVELFATALFSAPFSSYFVILINSLFVLPFLIILQTQMYMEKYPLAR